MPPRPAGTLTDTDDFLRELHHRVKNNFQIIASLMNLQKRMLPPDRRGELRFLEEHVQSMAIAYRVVYANNELVSVSVTDLVTEVLDGLQQIAGGRKSRLALETSETEQPIGLNQAVALSLYLAATVPPLLDHATTLPDSKVKVRVIAEHNHLVLSCAGDWNTPIAVDKLRTRLTDAYMRQLGAKLSTDPSYPPNTIQFDIDIATVDKV